MIKFFTPLFISATLLIFFTASFTSLLADGENCDAAVLITEGSYTAPNPDYWYSFTVPATGFYLISTCDPDNSCNTKIYLYDHCAGLIPTELAEGTYGYNDDFCGIQSQVSASFLMGDEIFIRIGDFDIDCSGQSIDWTLSYVGEPAGCIDPYACNYSPLAMIDDGSCIYPGNPDCPSGPDLVLDEEYFDGEISGGWGTDFQLTTVNADETYNECYLEEGSLTGTGIRTVIKFGMKVRNDGDEDYHIGAYGENPFIVWDDCHGHDHYVDYGEYLLYDTLGNELPVGHKNGFCVLDLCGFGGYGCGDMGITAGCYDAYGLGTGGQWMDITDVTDGIYTFVARVNWANHPDIDGRVEVNFSNNWRSRCMQITRDIDSVISVELLDDCPAYIDCLGEIWGTAKGDCEGICDGWHDLGDVNLDSTRTNVDVNQYISQILSNTIIAEMCNDANMDSDIDVVDAALVMGCSNQALGYTHAINLCDLPVALLNTSDTVTFSIGSVNAAFNYLDIYSLNPSARILGAQFQMEGLTIDSVVNLLPETFGTNYQITYTDNEVIALGFNEVPYQLHFDPIPSFRIFYSATYPVNICIKHFTAAVNEDFEEVITDLNENCVTVDATSVTYLSSNPLNVKIQPNPFSETAVLNFTNYTGKTFNLQLNDLNGNMIRSYTTISNSITINRSELPAGVYIYRLTGADESQTGKFIIQ